MPTGRFGDITPQGTALNSCHGGQGVDLDPVHGIKLDQDGRSEVVLDERAGVVAGAHRCDLVYELAGGRDHSRHFGSGSRFGNCGGTQIDRCVPQRPRLVIARIARQVDHGRTGHRSKASRRIDGVLTPDFGEDRVGLQSHESPIVGRDEVLIRRQSTLIRRRMPRCSQPALTSHLRPRTHLLMRTCLPLSPQRDAVMPTECARCSGGFSRPIRRSINAKREEIVASDDLFEFRVD